DPPATGLADAGPTPGPGEGVINELVADDLGVAAGDTIEVHAYGQRLDLAVRTVAPRGGLAGAAHVYVAPGTLADLAAGSNAGEPPLAAVLVSNTGGTFDGAAHTDEVARALDERLAGLDGVEVGTPKQDLIDDASEAATSLRSLF